MKTQAMHFLVINGPNLNLLGTREPSVYGTDSLAHLENVWRQRAGALDIELYTFQSNHEGAIIDAIQNAREYRDAIVINPGALSHYSYAIHDTLTAVALPTVEVHISNILEREEWRSTSVTAPAAGLTIYGRGVAGYIDAINHLWADLTVPAETISYGPDPENVMDLRIPDDPSGVVMLIHGGFWNDQWKRDIMDPLAVGLHERGWATANIEYRRGAGSYASSTHDVAGALAWLLENTDRFGTNRVLQVGHSAGGYLALRGAESEPRLFGTVALSPVAAIGPMSDVRPQDDPVARYLGASRSENTDLWAEADLDGAPVSPVRLLHGLKDEDVPTAQSESYVQRSGGKVPVTIAAGIGHNELIDPNHAVFETLVSELASFS
jgi:3-dehydroquinate dehydratase-2